MEQLGDTVFAFLLVVTVDGVDVDTDGMLFYDILRCSFIAEEIEKSANRTATGYGGTVEINTKAWCKPILKSKKTEFFN